MAAPNSSESAALHYEVHEGSGPPLLLVHGMLSSRAQWDTNLTALRRVASPVVVELLGHGRSPTPDDPAAYHPEAYVDAFERIRGELGEARWLVCGQSLGAALTLRYALRQPERVIAQVFTNSTSSLADATWSERSRRGMERLAAQVARDGAAAIERMPVHPRHSRRLPPEVRDALVAEAARHSPQGVVRTGLYTVPESSVRDAISQIRTPTLLVRGTRERGFAGHARFAHQHLPGLESAEFDAGHAVNIEVGADFDRVVLEFFSRMLARDRN
jgi:2-succinyl-6-hydroxy-2,4-cyclohexadiene-1-carboxylate synthase